METALELGLGLGLAAAGVIRLAHMYKSNAE